jgi:hypothetical protein
MMKMRENDEGVNEFTNEEYTIILKELNNSINSFD